MHWSKIKQLVEKRFAASLKGRLTINLTRYRKSSSDHLYELWFSFDGEKLFDVSDGRWHEAMVKMQADSDGVFDPDNWDKIELETPSGLTSKNLVEQSLNLPVDAMIAHESPVVRLLGVADARFGERRLKQPEFADGHPMVMKLIQLRRQIDGVHLASDAVSQSSATFTL